MLICVIRSMMIFLCLEVHNSITVNTEEKTYIKEKEKKKRFNFDFFFIFSYSIVEIISVRDCAVDAEGFE